MKKLTDNVVKNFDCSIFDRHLDLSLSHRINTKLLNKIARPQESQSFTAYTISKEQYDS